MKAIVLSCTAVLLGWASSAQAAMPTPLERVIATNNACSNLSPEEQQFAIHLCYPHRMAFCQEFTGAQRRAAIRLMYRYNMLPNEAVHMVITQQGGYAALSPSPCKKLGSRQYAFAMNMCPAHREVFCTQFTARQRKRALGLVHKHPMLTPDQAVHFIMEENGMGGRRSCSAPMMPPSRGIGMSCGCPRCGR